MKTWTRTLRKAIIKFTRQNALRWPAHYQAATKEEIALVVKANKSRLTSPEASRPSGRRASAACSSTANREGETAVTEAAKIYLSGNTYPVKDALRALGCRWDADAKQWFCLDEETATKAKKIISDGAKPGGLGKSRFTKCQVCGVAASRYVKIYGSGECPDCYEERKMGY